MKARFLYLGREKIFQQSNKIEFAKKLRRELTAPNVMHDDNTLRALLEEENIYDTAYRYYKKKYENIYDDYDYAEDERLNDIITSITFDYTNKYFR